LSCGNNFAFRGIKLAAAALGLAFASQVSISRAEDKKSSACNEDAMIVFDANAALPVMSAVNALVPAGKTPLTATSG